MWWLEIFTGLTFALSRLKSAVAPVLFFFRKKFDFGMVSRLSPPSFERFSVSGRAARS